MSRISQIQVYLINIQTQFSRKRSILEKNFILHFQFTFS